MSEWSIAVEVCKVLGIPGLLILVGCRLAGQFLEVGRAQAASMSQLAEAVKDNRGDQHEILLAMRVMSSKLDEQKEFIRELDYHCRALAGPNGVSP